ncbi:MAG: hypothetical protein IPK79_11545 [Vampirovibrionales bacterium]|nr:hypothetical protein [Vampirovibrionales bacterium]
MRNKIFYNIYDSCAQWQCRQNKTGQTDIIGGALAQILKQYPHEYELTFLSPEGVWHEYDA